MLLIRGVLLSLAASVIVLFLGCTTNTRVLEANTSGYRSPTVTVQYMGGTAPIGQESIEYFEEVLKAHLYGLDEVDELYGPAGFKKGSDLVLQYRFVDRVANSGTDLVQVEGIFYDVEGAPIGRVLFQSEVRKFPLLGIPMREAMRSTARMLGSYSNQYYSKSYEGVVGGVGRW